MQTIGLLRRLATWLRRPELLVFLPAVTLAGFWYGGERVLVALAIGVPFVVTFAGAFRLRADAAPVDPLSGMIQRPQLVSMIDGILATEDATGQTTACLVILFDDADRVLDRHGRAARVEIMSRNADRMIGAPR
ncbi:MAG: hypothetical protein V4516_05065 [Pseudomonadota bacterium]